MTTLSQALAAYRTCAKAEGKSPKTVSWITDSLRYFMDFLGGDQDISAISPDDLRRFIIGLQESHKWRNHPYTKVQAGKLSPQSVETYARAIRAFFGYLYREELIDHNPMQKVKMPKVPTKVVPTLTEKQVEKLLAQPDQHTARGFRDYTLLAVYIDTSARLSEIVNLTSDGVDLENGYLKVMGKGQKERFLPFGSKVSKALLKYRLKYRPQPQATDRFFLTQDGRPLPAKRVQKIIHDYGLQARVKVYCHKLRHTSSVMYLRNGGDPFSLQKKLGHSSLAMTRHYSNLADSDVKAKQLKYGVLDRLKV
ncbi:MAG: tyrosine-type recombinase/integrase [Chloroflexi bacterium]|nr:tyrosine-type recombinase/integrase [Chloroflexota bacterium]